MSPSSSSDSPRDPAAPARAPEPRRLLTPQERFGTVETVSSGAELPAPDALAPDPFVSDPFVSDPFAAEKPASTRLEDEMARRHLPPHLRRKHARTLRKREKREAKRRIHSETTRHVQRGEVEREFAVAARQEAPQPRAKRRRRVPVVLKRLFWLVCLLFCVQLGVAAFSAPQFAIQSVNIVGLSATQKEELRPLELKLIGQNFLRADGKPVEKAAEMLPTVASAQVIRLVQWPPQVQLSITERQPVLKVGAGADWWVVDGGGVPFRRPAAQDNALYAVVAPQFAPALLHKLNPKVWRSAAALNDAIQADNRLVESEKRPAEGENRVSALQSPKIPFWQLRRIYFDKDGLASLRLKGKGMLIRHNEMLVRLGDDKWSEKLARARVALSYFERTGRRAQELDLVSLERPVWRPIPAQLSVQTDSQGQLKTAG